MSTRCTIKYERDEATGQEIHLYEDLLDGPRLCVAGGRRMHFRNFGIGRALGPARHPGPTPYPQTLGA